MPGTLLEGLNNEQLKAVTHASGPLLIVAGAGTGKTTVITRRIAYLIEQKLAKPDEILALTFTEKAASEMEERVDLLSPIGYTDFWISTFHSFCERILKLHALEIGLPNDFELLDDTKQWILVHKNLDAFKLDYYRPLGNPSKFISAMLQHFSRCKDELISPEDYLQYAEQMKLSLDNPDFVKTTSGKPDFALSSSNPSLSFPRRRESKAALEGGTGPRIREDDNAASDDYVVIELKRITELADAYHVYQKLLLDNDYLDFGDLINYTLELFKRRPNILEFYRRKFKHILVDEFQDTNVAQYELVKLLAQRVAVKSTKLKVESKSNSLSTFNFQLSTNLTVVGDDDQSIYKFRGASVSNILKFKDNYSNLTQITLIQNYRSTQEILDLSYKLIQNNNPDRLEVKLGISKRLVNPQFSPPAKEEYPGASQGEVVNTDDKNNPSVSLNANHLPLAGKENAGEIQVLEGHDLSDELDMVVKKIIELKNENPTVSWNSFAILIRARGASDEILPRLEAAGIPFTYLANTGLYRKQLIADLIGYLKLLDNYHESGSLYRTLNFPKFRLPAQDLASLVQYSAKHTLSLYETLQKDEALEKISEPSRQSVAKLLSLLASHTELAKDRSAVEVFVTAVRDLHVASMLEEETLENAQNRELLEQFYKQIERFEQDKTTSNKSLKVFLSELELELRAGHDGDIKFDPNLGPESLKVLTVHAAKGLEFENVFVVNLVDQRFPTREKSSGIDIPVALIKDILPEGDFHLQEERRLFYVALTRAKKRLYLTWSRDYGGSRAKKPSIFLQETELVPSEKVTAATGRVVFTRPDRHPKRQVYKDLPKVFSYSAIMTFLECPLDYKYAHYLKLPLPGTPQLSFGITIHTTLQKYLEEYERSLQTAQVDLFGKTAKPELPSFERLLEIYVREWVDEWYPNKTSKEGYRDKGKEQLKTFYDHSKKEIPKPKLIEKRFNLKLGEFTFTGKIDRVDSASGGVSIIDYKTGNPPKKKGELDIDQLRIYQWACEEQFKEKVVSLCYWYLDKNEFRDVEVAAGSELVELQEKLLATIHEIRDAVKFDRFAEKHQQSKQHTCNFEGYL